MIRILRKIINVNCGFNIKRLANIRVARTDADNITKKASIEFELYHLKVKVLIKLLLLFLDKFIVLIN